MALALDIGIAVNTRSFGSFIRTTESESYVLAQMMEEEDCRGIMTYPRSQNINGGKAGVQALSMCEFFPGACKYSRASCVLATWLSTHRSPSLPFLLV